VKIVNASNLVDEVRMVKSEEELKLHRVAAYLHERSYEAAKKAIQPGRTAYEVIQEIRYAQLMEGSEEQQMAIGFGQPAAGSARYDQGNCGNTFVRRPFKYGDTIGLLLESSAAGGYWYDLRRCLCIGKVPRELNEVYEIAMEARRIMAANCKPGVMPAVALDASDDFLKSKDCPPEPRLGGHGQGYDLVERPVIRRDEPAKLENGMIVALHPMAKIGDFSASISDTYVISESGAIPIYRNLFDDGGVIILG
jgi:Xaa-Pro aminopeptidase